MFKGARFEQFELDLGKRELRKHGVRLRVPDQSLEILTMLVERAGEVVGREEIRNRLWPNGTVVEFEHSVNSAVKRLRDALGETSASPRFIETLARRGYRFLTPVEMVRPQSEDSRYRIVHEAGRGAMGVVYRADDTVLGRPVALKFLADDLAREPSAVERLGREARLSAGLNHPGICTLYGLEEHEGRPCLVMEFLEGTSLARLIEAGPLPAERAMEIAIEVSAALSAAHTKGIVHRDIKPGNLFVTRDGPTKVTDFGIARRAGDGVSAAGGTPHYASPEQSRGGELDGRSDIFSLGMVVKEMLAGRRSPNGGGDPAPIEYPRNTPKGLERIIARCVESDPAARFQTAEELRSALKKLQAETGRRASRKRRAATAAVLLLGIAMAGVIWQRGGFQRSRRSDVRSVAVLPLVNLSGDAAQEHLADGMTEALTSDLAELGSFRVTSRTSAMTYKGSREPIAKIADRLRVDALLEGSISRSGNRVRVVAQLIDAVHDTHLWSKTYERDFEDLHLLERELAQAIADEIEVAVRPERRSRLTARRPNPEAYEAYLKGMFHLNKFTPEGFEKGMWHLRQAIEKDPTEPSAYAKLALGYAMMGHDRSPETFAKAKAAARKSLEMGGAMAEAYALLGMVELYSDWEFADGARNLRRALELNPSLAEARRAYSWYLQLVGRGREGLAEMSRAVELDPLAPIFAADLAWQQLDQGHLDAALTEARKALELDPGFAQALAIAGWVYREKKMDAEAVAAHEKAAEDAAWRWPLARTYALLGRRVEARRIAAELATNPGPMDQWGLAAIHAALGDKDEAFRWLEEAYKSRFSFMPWNHVPDLPTYGTESDLFAPLRADPRFRELARRIGVK